MPVAQTEISKRVYIPDVPEDRIRELGERIKPVMMFARRGQRLSRSGRGFLYYLEPVDLFGIAYTWDPKPTTRATGLRTLTDITTYHSWGHYSLFKPSIAEVLAVIPEQFLDKVVAFEIIEQPETAADFNRDIEAFNAGYHVATTRLYTSK